MAIGFVLILAGSVLATRPSRRAPLVTTLHETTPREPTPLSRTG